MSEVVVQEENTRESIEQALELARAHYYEVEEKADKVPFNLDINLIYEYMKLNLLYLIVARDGEEMVGYFANMISPDPITSLPIGKEFGIYVKPAYRKGSVFSRMLELVEEGGQARGAYSQLLMFKEGHDVGLAQKCGYDPTERVYQKVFEV